MKKKEYHFWFSEKQESIRLRMNNMCIVELKAKLINDKIVKYSECTKTTKGSNFEDSKYLGVGVIYSIDGVIQT